MVKEENKVICSVYVGEHVESTAKHFSKWMTGCLEGKVTPKEFKKNWANFEEEGNPTDKVPGMDNDGEYWIDVLSFEGTTADEFYEAIVKEKADRIITFNNNAYVDLVAIRGQPTPRDIATYVLGEKNASFWSEQDTKDYLGEEYLK